MQQIRSFVVHTCLCLAILASAFIVQLGQPEPAGAAAGDQQRVVYLDRGNNVWTSRTDGSDARQLTSNGGYSDVWISPDGSRILATAPYDGGTGVYLMSPDPAFPSRSIAAGRSPAWSPDNSRFAFAQDGDVHIFDRDGGYIRTVEAPASVLEWSPDGRHIGFARILVDPYGSGCPVRQIGWIDSQSGSVETGGSMIGEFAWNGDGTALLHVSAVDGNLRARSVVDDQNDVISSRLISPCNAPFFSTADGEHIIAARWSGEGATDLIVINQQTLDDQVYTGVPVSFPASRIPNAYITGDATGRYVLLARSYPTDIHRLDLETGEMSAIVTNDWRRLVGFAPDGGYYALLETPSGKAQRMSVHDSHSMMHTMENVGWLRWAPSQLNLSAAVAWQRNWDREDRPVVAGESRTWLWGPEHFDARLEEYREAPDGHRAVRYYDKSRMEITHPAADRSSEWYVTNGLLVRELITGDMQVGDSEFIQRDPAGVPVAGDENDPDSPTYAMLEPLLSAPASEPGDEITAMIDQSGRISDGGPGDVFAEHFVEDTGHTVADVFWEYLNSAGRIWDGQQFTEGQLFQPTFFATGFPITGAYWATVRVDGVPQDVLLQCFERRCLTYTPENPEGWEVEMGNVGRHYHAWRYE